MKNRKWKDFPELKIFEEDYDKDYVYEERKNIPILIINSTNEKDPIQFEIGLDRVKKSGFVGGKSMVLLTMRGAIKFNMWKRTEGGKPRLLIFKIFFDSILGISHIAHFHHDGYKRTVLFEKDCRFYEIYTIHDIPF